MSFYDLTKGDRIKKVEQIHHELLHFFKKKAANELPFFADEDTYIRKAAYQAVGKIFNQHEHLRETILKKLQQSLSLADDHTRQTIINTAGEIGMKHFEKVELFFDAGLFDSHHSVRNAVIGSIKKMGEKNPKPVLTWAKKYLHHPDKEIRREICHGIELRGRTHPEDILPLLQELQHDSTARVRNTLIHVLGQISYKNNCLAKVIEHIRNWENRELVMEALIEIVDVHERYRDFAVLSQNEAKKYIEEMFDQAPAAGSRKYKAQPAKSKR